MKTYDLYFPLGASCACTQILRHCKIQFRSFPFDWLIGADIVDRATILANHFKDFLKKEAMECVEESKRNRGRDIWRNNDSGLLFMHDFTHGTPFEEEYPIVYQKYQRRAKRLIQQISSSKRVLAVYAEHPCDTKSLTKEQMVNARRILSEAFPAVHIDLLYLRNDNSVLISNAQEYPICDGISEISFCYNMFNVYAPYEVNLPMAAAALNHFDISDLHISPDDARARTRFKANTPSASELILRQKLGIKLNRYIMHYAGYYSKVKLFHSFIRHLYKKI